MNPENTPNQKTLPRRRRWIGGANLPTRGGSRVNAGWSLAELVLEGDLLTLQLRGPLNRVFRSKALVAMPTEVDSVFPIDSSPLRFRGVGFRRSDGLEYYFKTGRAQEILPALRIARFNVSEKPQKATQIWHAKS